MRNLFCGPLPGTPIKGGKEIEYKDIRKLHKRM